MHLKRMCALAVLTALLNGCSGGASTMPQLASPNAAATAVPQAKTAAVAFHIVVPSAAPASNARRLAYISAATASASIAVGTATPVVVNCTTTCSGTVNAAVGSDTFSVNLYSGPNGAGSVLSTGTLTQTIVAATANSVNVTFNGVVATLAVTLATVTPGTAGSAGVTVNALDAGGNVIVGPGVYVNAAGAPVTLTLADSDTSGRSSLSQTIVTQPTAGITLNYTAAFSANPTISASASGFTTAQAVVAFPAPTLTGLSAVSGVTGNIVAEKLTGTNFVSGQTTVAISGTTAVSQVTVLDSTTLSAEFTPLGSFGVQSVTLTTPAGTSGTQPFAVALHAVAVTAQTDSGAGVPPGTGSGQAGDLRQAIVTANANPGSAITFTGCAPSTPCTIVLSGPLPPITVNTVLDGGTYGSVIIDGGSTFRALWAETGTIVIANLLIRNAIAQGGNGGAAESVAGGGGAGLGAGLFIDTAAVTAVNDEFLNDGVAGGRGGDSTGAPSGNAGSGGGGLGGAGGSSSEGAAGGGGILGPGAADGGPGDGGAGGVGFSNSPASGAPESLVATPPTPATAGFGGGGGGGGSYAGTSELPGGSGGPGGFGGGGGGGAEGTIFVPDSGNGGPGGFGGGGGSGGAYIFSEGGNGGPGGGGGTGVGIGGTGGVLATLSGGAGGPVLYGGGGAAAGPAIFVNTGTLTTLNSDASNCTATGGAAGGVGAGNGTSDATPVFSYNGTINGTAVAGPAAAALGTATP